jgi:sec-independent protein translocase protein TatB
MFGISGGEFIVLVLAAIFLLGPEKLPKASRDLARLINKVRTLANNATTELRENLGPGYEDLKVEDLHPKKLIARHLNEALDEPVAEISEISKNAKIDPDLL